MIKLVNTLDRSYNGIQINETVEVATEKEAKYYEENGFERVVEGEESSTKDPYKGLSKAKLLKLIADRAEEVEVFEGEKPADDATNAVLEQYLRDLDTAKAAKSE